MDNRSYQKSKAFQSPAFILGEERSGTTLLASMLNRHPEICVTPEIHYFQHLSDYPLSWDKIILNWPSAGEEFLRQLPKWYMLKLLEDKVVSNVLTHSPSPGDLFYALGEAYCKRFLKQRWIEKTPFNMHYIPEIRELFPSAKFLHIVRDGRDVALSLCKVDWPWQTKSYIKNLMQWVESARLSKKYLVSDPLTFHIYYEELIFDPAVMMQKVCEFLGVEYNNSILIPDGSEDSLIELNTTCKDNNRKKLISNNSFKWKRELSDEQISLASMLAGEELAYWGYEISQRVVASSQLIFIPKQIFSLAKINIDSILENFIKNNFRIKLLNNITVLQALKLTGANCVVFGNSPCIELTKVSFLRRVSALLRIWWQLLRRKLTKTSLILFYYEIDEEINWRFRQLYDKALYQHVSLVVYLNENKAVNNVRSDLSIKRKKIAHFTDPNLDELISEAFCK